LIVIVYHQGATEQYQAS